jgi:hypothetical protein
MPDRLQTGNLTTILIPTTERQTELLPGGRHGDERNYKNLDYIKELGATAFGTYLCAKIMMQLFVSWLRTI